MEWWDLVYENQILTSEVGSHDVKRKIKENKKHILFRTMKVNS